jgi:spore coat protein U-like protein
MINFQLSLYKESFRMKVLSAVKFAFPAAVIGFLTLGLTSTSAFAVTTVTTTFGVTATVQATCLVSATAMGFGTYTGVAIPTTSTVSVTCTNTTPYNVGLSAGLGTGATVSARKMTGPAGALLNYAMYSDSGRTTNWGNTIGTDTVTGTGNGAAQPLTVYGQLAASQYLAPGLYSDTITATVTW